MVSDILVGVSLGDHGYRHRSYRLFGVAMFEVPGRSPAPQKDFADLYESYSRIKIANRFLARTWKRISLVHWESHTL